MKEISIQDLKVNPYTLFSKNWLALTAGNEERGFNAMTIAWGQLGAVWERDSHSNRLPTAVCYVRPGRYTQQFMEKEEYFTLSRLPEQYRRALGYLGTHSGRDGDKIKESGLTPVFEDDTTYFEEADLVFVCRKLYSEELTEAGFADQGLVDFNYPDRDFHVMYVGEIVKVLVKE